MARGYMGTRGQFDAGDENHREIKIPSGEFLTQMAMALKEAEHKSVAQHAAAGLIWAIYPEWFETIYEPFVLEFRQEKKESNT